ncbi:MAG TPA: hypothetical protein DEB17_04725 [Chlorobaculum sp.]|uniref:Uncharacterized protein n=1 Tax=Chlorobaculum tepidum (strain ATCC 49652 / DSM 12025 / NBRC 103806 / TLS) TaxID=194439 RepID=Q8KB58_CHLTE|nr:hypothetical protein CT1933 [Chlorobaculum tepidum TLS]HBU23288.1 hypothetical protein [Chlorobaculum sp.]
MRVSPFPVSRKAWIGTESIPEILKPELYYFFRLF